MKYYYVDTNLNHDKGGAPAEAIKAKEGKSFISVTSAYQKPSLAKSSWQLCTTFLLFIAILYASYLSLSGPLGWTLLLSMLAGGFVLRIFIIQHDCGHGSFFESRRLNDLVGFLCSAVTLIPYLYWRKQHALHHASNGALDHRGHGDMDTITVREYLALSKWQRFKYRFYRNPFVFLLLGPIFFILVVNRCVLDRKKTTAKERRNVYITNAFVAIMFSLAFYALGFEPVLKIALPMFFFAAAGGIWLFYIQHQFEHTYWKWDDEWSYVAAAMQGSSFYKLPKLLQWLTGNIGFHHIHHLNPSVPNYNLELCHDQNPQFQKVVTITLWESLQTMFLSVWDETQNRLISFRELRSLGYN